MNRIISVITLVLVFSFGLVLVNGYARESISKGWHRTYEVGEMVGSPVKNPQGDELGRIHDFVIDSNGRVAFAILSFGWEYLRAGEKTVAVPFDALTYHRRGQYFVLDISKERLASAPPYDRSDVANEQWAEDTYKYFGQQPYWTERSERKAPAKRMTHDEWIQMFGY
jgi:sporulation protein YlmC with PRC-barrel domain